jgi:hypothetical protein
MAMRIEFQLAAVLAALACAAPTAAQRAAVSHADGVWTIRGAKNTVALNERDLSVNIRAGSVTWKMVPSSDHDVLVGSGGPLLGEPGSGR